MLKFISCFLVLIVSLSSLAQAQNYPCSKSKGGVARCEGTRFKCKNGSYSASKKHCTPALAEAYK